ncbi:MAG: glycosyltransferase family 4 protein [Nitrospiraceae bacterium]
MATETVCHIITKLELGGAQQNTLFTVAHLDRVRFRPVLLSGESGFLDAEARALAGVEFHQISSLTRSINPIQDTRAFLELTALLKRLKPTIVHTHSSKAGILGRLAAWRAGVPIIVHSIHGFGVTPEQHPLQRRVLLSAERLAARVTTWFVAVCEANRKQGVQLGLFSAGRCTVIRSGVDLAAIRKTRVDVGVKKRELGFDPDRPLVGMIAPMKPQKAPLDFVRMASMVHRQRPDAGFLFVGEGALRLTMETELARSGLAQSVRLIGWRRDVPEILRCLDIFVLTSRWEGLPRTYLEAMASGVPVVGTRVDGAEEVIHDGVNGFLVDPGDVTGLSQRVLTLLMDPSRAKNMGRQGDMLLGQEFDIWHMVRQQEREYGRLIDTRRRDRSSDETADQSATTPHRLPVSERAKR